MFHGVSILRTGCLAVKPRSQQLFVNTLKRSAKAIILNDIRRCSCLLAHFAWAASVKEQPKQVTSSEAQDGLLPAHAFENGTTFRRDLRQRPAIDALVSCNSGE